MERSAEAYRTLAEELILAWRHIEGQYQKNREMSRRIDLGQTDEFDWAALGYTLHNAYNALENYFLRVAKFFENSLDPTTWHKDLVDRMVLPIEGVRPAVLPEEIRLDLHELRSFRHVFRNIYDSVLDSGRVERVNALLPNVVETMKRAHLAFESTLRDIADAL